MSSECEQRRERDRGPSQAPFVVVLPGADLRQTAALAEDLRAAVVTDADGGNQRVTLNRCVRGSARGKSFRYREVFAAADGRSMKPSAQDAIGRGVATLRGLGRSSLAPVQPPAAVPM